MSITVIFWLIVGCTIFLAWWIRHLLGSELASVLLLQRQDLANGLAVVVDKNEDVQHRQLALLLEVRRYVRRIQSEHVSTHNIVTTQFHGCSAEQYSDADYQEYDYLKTTDMPTNYAKLEAKSAAAEILFELSQSPRWKSVMNEYYQDAQEELEKVSEEVRRVSEYLDKES